MYLKDEMYPRETRGREMDDGNEDGQWTSVNEVNKGSDTSDHNSENSRINQRTHLVMK